MSNTPQGENWWLASDGKWYPPQQTTPPQPATPPQYDAPTAQNPQYDAPTAQNPQYDATQQFAVPTPAPQYQPQVAQQPPQYGTPGAPPYPGQMPPGPGNAMPGQFPPAQFPPQGVAGGTPPKDSKKPLLYGLVALLGVIIVGIAIFVATRDDDTDTASSTTETTEKRSTTTTPVEDDTSDETTDGTTDDTIDDSFGTDDESTDDTIADDPFGEFPTEDDFPVDQLPTDGESFDPELQETILDATWDNLGETERAQLCSAVDTFGIDGTADIFNQGAQNMFDLDLVTEKITEWCPTGG